MFCPTIVSKNVFYPVWDIWDNSQKLQALKNLEQSQWKTPAELEAYQWQQFKNILNYAYLNSPYYKKLLDSTEITPASFQTRADLSLLPITRKLDVRNSLPDFLSTAHEKAELMQAKTGGSTGFSLELYFDKECQEHRNAAALRSDRWAGWDLGMVRGELWGNPPRPESVKEKIRHALLDRVFYLDTMRINGASIRSFLEVCRQHKIEVIFGHAHSIYIYAKYIKDEALSVEPLRGIIATSMMLLSYERELIEEVFGCKVTNRYGCEEVGLIACECEKHQGMHINAENVLVEFIREDGAPASENEMAKIVVTDLRNKGMPLLRYQIEDMGSFSSRPCNCGRGLPLLDTVSGRVADFLKTRSGDSVAGISLIERTLTKVVGIEQMQLVQDELERLKVNRVKGQGYSEESDQVLIDELKEVFGDDVSIDIRDVDCIPQLANGKYRFSICNL